jgi:protein TonB
MAVAPVPEERFGFLRSCLVEGDSVQEARVRRNKQRALLVSIVFQILIVTALVLLPLLSHGERITVRGDFVPIPPPARFGHRSPRDRVQKHPTTRPAVCRFCPPTYIPTSIVDQDPLRSQQIVDDNPGESEIDRYGSPDGRRDGLLDSNREVGPPPPTEKKAPARPRRIHFGTIEPAMLIHRVEPVYPALGRQLRREGRVELHAIISTDGAVQSVEVISGDPLFIQSALAAVREWRYRPTILNGQPYEVDTHITVVYTLSR